MAVWGCSNTLELSWQPSRARGLNCRCQGESATATDSLNAPPYKRFLPYTHYFFSPHFAFLKTCNLSSKKSPRVSSSKYFLLNHREKLPSPRVSEPHPVMAQQHFTAQCSPFVCKEAILRQENSRETIEQE